MKFKDILGLLIFLLWMPLSHAAGAVYILQVDGLGCPFCAFGIEKELSNLQGVNNVEVDLKNAQVIVNMIDDAVLDEPQVRTAVKDAGFTLRSFSQRQKNEKSVK